jgi:uncharacterized protein (TIGR02594 family)
MSEDLPVWAPIALRYKGVKEKFGLADNAQIVDWLSLTRIHPKHLRDETAWCAAFVGAMLEFAGIASTRSAAARSYAEWGLELEEPKLWCVAVLSRGSNPAHGHVGFYQGEDEERPGHILIYGGNQANEVRTSSYPKDRVLTYRWPELP